MKVEFTNPLLEVDAIVKLETAAPPRFLNHDPPQREFGELEA